MIVDIGTSRWSILIKNTDDNINTYPVSLSLKNLINLSEVDQIKALQKYPKEMMIMEHNKKPLKLSGFTKTSCGQEC